VSSSLSNLLYHVVFSTKYRLPMLRTCEEEVYRNICQIIETQGGHILAINGVEDHLHIALQLLPRHCISSILQRVKSLSAKRINEKRKSDFLHWQRGYGVFSISSHRRDATINYINSQKIHHAKITFQDEYREILKKSQTTFNENYLWD